MYACVYGSVVFRNESVCVWGGVDPSVNISTLDILFCILLFAHLILEIIPDQPELPHILNAAMNITAPISSCIDTSKALGLVLKVWNC